MPVTIDPDFTRCSAMWRFPLAVVVVALWRIYLEGGLDWYSIIALAYLALTPVFLLGQDPGESKGDRDEKGQEELQGNVE